MTYKIENKTVLKNFCLKRKLRALENKRNREIVSFIEAHPGQAAKMDNIENTINSETMREVEFKIRAIRRLLSKQGKN